MRAIAIGALSAGLFSLTSCIVDVGDWERFNKDFHSSYPLKPGGRLSLETFNGSVEISGWDEDNVDISGTKFGPTQDEADHLAVNVDAGDKSISIRVPRPTDWRGNLGARFIVKVPRNTQLDLISTSNSSIRTEDGAGPAHFRTTNGSVRVVDFRGDLEVETSNNSVELEDVVGNVRARSSNGHIRAERLEGALEATTSNNGVTAEIVRADKPVRVDTSNGGVDLRLPSGFGENVHVETRNGPITLRIPEGTNARLSARTSNSSIETELEVKAQGELSRNRLEGIMGSGGPLIELETSNGSIHLLRR